MSIACPATKVMTAPRNTEIFSQQSFSLLEEIMQECTYQRGESLFREGGEER